MSVMVLAAALTAQAAGQSAAEESPAPGMAPRTVYFAPARSSAALDGEGMALLERMPEMLATTIAVRQPIARSASADGARSVITVAAASSTRGRVSVTVSLLEEGAVKSETRREFGSRSLDLAPLQGFMEDTAARLAPLLQPVEALTETQKLMESRQFIETTREADELLALDKRWEFSLWMSGFLRIIDNTAMDSGGSYYFDAGLGPLIADATWFFNREMGVQLSLFFNESSAFDFGANSRSRAYGIFLFPGVGIVYRTVGRVSAEYTATLSAGWVYVNANNGDVRDRDNNVVIPYGSSAWSGIAPRVRLSPALVWCITPSLALKAAIAVDIIVPKLFPWYDSPIGGLQFLSVGAAWRL
jgi:hypothetical protein